jgi:asparagine synthase (glutamine-hydrolysing)
MLAKEASRSVKMVLTGEGSDEILGGYPKHVFERFAQAYQLLPGYIRHRLIAPLTHSLPYDFRRAKTAITNLNIEDWRERYVRWFGALNHAGARPALGAAPREPRRRQRAALRRGPRFLDAAAHPLFRPDRAGSRTTCSSAATA